MCFSQFPGLKHERQAYQVICARVLLNWDISQRARSGKSTHLHNSALHVTLTASFSRLEKKGQGKKTSLDEKKAAVFKKKKSNKRTRIREKVSSYKRGPNGNNGLVI